ncbi:amidohydrolase family protein [Granulicella cerasi]|uniref:Amidohydrolase family protein n=1 Tax=Granulicella cerasi TaxID=741063 RepID=A0ABW1ZCZ3_9BACT|nr:amidohydrolase family protein [Granulicella cerasi]
MHAFAPTPIDLLITGCDVVTFDDHDTVLLDGAIAVQGKKIAWIGKASEAAALYNAKETINGSGMIAMPGLIDAHYHTGQQLLRGKLASIHRKHASKAPHWKNYYVPFESGLTPEDVYCSAIAGYTSMISVGTTCFLEAGGPHPDEMGRAAMDVGIRGFVSLNTMDMDDTLPSNYRMTTAQALKENEALVKRWKDNDRVGAWLSLRQIIVNTEELRIGMTHLAKELNVPIHTHLSEGTYEVDFTVNEYGKRPPAYMDSIGSLHEHIHAAHSVLLTNEELDLYAARKVSACHCSFGNYGVGPQRFYEMIRRDIACGLGTDGPGGRCTLDMFEVAHFAVLGQTIEYGTLFHSGAPIGYDKMLKLACRNGARAARMADKIGSLEVNKLADVVLVAKTDFDQFPVVDPVITLSQNCNGRDVRTVVIDGRVVMKNREFISFDLAPMRRHVQEQYTSIMQRYDVALDKNHTPH